MKKVLFITNAAGIYGSARSLQLLLNHYDNMNIDLIVAKRILGGYSIAELRKRFWKNVKSIKKFHLPIDYCIVGMPKLPLILFLYKLFLKILWNMSKRKLYKTIKRGNYDFIHLNSLVLHQIITREYPFIIHVREIFDQKSVKAVESLQKSRGIIFIDESSRQSFSNFSLPHSIVLNNPIDMTPLNTYSKVNFEKRYIDFKNDTIFSVIGKITETKGIDFIIECFMKLKNSRTKLLIVGSGDILTVTKAKILANHDKRIIFWGEEPDILKIYATSDYILRGEPFQCIGRTMYEGLYAGCKVIIPARKEGLNVIFEYEKFADSIYYYSPRNSEELIALFEKLSNHKVYKKTFHSNVSAYVDKFHEFVTSVLNIQGKPYKSLREIEQIW